MAQLFSLTRRPIIRIVLSLLLLVGLIVAVAFLFLRPAADTTPRTYQLIQPRRTTITASVNATGQIEPAQTSALSFTTPGRVESILVTVGQTVTAGQAIAQLDRRELQLRLNQAKAQLQQAEANRAKVLAGASSSEIAIAQAQVQQAESQLRQIVGSVTAADLSAAQAQLEQAQAILAAAEAGPDPTQVKLNEQALAQAQAQLESQRDQLSTAKTNAELGLNQASNSLTQAQSRYATAKENWEFVQRTGQDPINPSVPDTQRPGNTKPNKVNDAQRRQYYDAFVQAEAALRTAENSLKQAELQLEQARQAEINGIQVAEQQVAQAQTRLDQVRGGATPDQLAAARAQAANAQANINRLRGEQRNGAVGAAQAAVVQAAARLSQLQADPASSDLQLVDAQLASAKASLDLAQLAFDQAILTAPFAGTVAELNLQVGETANVPRAVVVADLSQFVITVRVDEIDIARIAVNQPVTITLDALPDVSLPGTVMTISPLAVAQTGIQSSVTSYQVEISATALDARVRPGMSASAEITVARKDEALLIPRRAVRNDRGRLVVDMAPTALCSASELPVRPELTQREVRTGLSNELLIEILDGLDGSECLYVEGVDARLRAFLGPPPGVRPGR